MASVETRAETTLIRPSVGKFGVHELVGLPEPVRRFFERAVAPDTPLAQSARIAMRGHMKVGRWLPFRARETLTPHVGFVWSARAAGLIVGSDRFVDGHGRMDWRLGGFIPLISAEGADVSRSAAQRGGAEAVWVPSSLLPRFGVDWEASGDTRITARFGVDEHPLEVHCTLNGEDQIESVVFQRWGDPDNEGVFALHPFGGEFTSHASFGGVHIPTAGRLGWHYGTDRWSEGEFFRFRLTDLELVP